MASLPLFLACQMQTGIKVHLHCHTMVFSFDGLSGFLIYTSNVIVNPAAKSSSRTSHAVLDSSWNFPATSTQAEKGILPVVWTKPASPSSPRRLPLAVFPSPSSPRRLPLAVFASPSSPLRLRLSVFATPSSQRHPRLTVFARARLLLIAVIVERRVFGLHHQVSPDLSSDKSPFHRIPLKRCVANVEKQPTGCNGLAANGLT
ncbi:hypothetical protein OUZ56_006367 [Daphnia magna]|uniref:Uncharacterized protein n=1 Tax=Daphnia magna TaxID=35525 RepID=A0ABQ9YVZ7_9CRUS|nr:hypothetical protein OUZ56_006367 [Daphnia magna]